MRLGILTVVTVLTFAARGWAACIGDCSGNGEVTVDELIRGVNIALGTSPASQCTSFDINGDDEVTINELITAVNSALIGCTVDVAGDYSGQFMFGNRRGTLELSVDASGHAGGALIVASAGALASAASAVTFPVGSLTVTLIGTVDTENGSFQVSGSFTDGNDQSTQVTISGTLPTAPDAATITALVGDESFSGMLSAGTTPTPVPTASGPTPTPVASCGNGSFTLTFSNVSADSNVNKDTGGLGKIIANDIHVGNFYSWVISGAACNQSGSGDPARGFEINSSDASTGILPGTYAISSSSTPPFIRVNYKDTRFVFGNPSLTYAHAWVGSQGTLEITDAGGGNLYVHAIGVVMTPNPVSPSAIGTFTLDVSGVLTKVNHL